MSAASVGQLLAKGGYWVKDIFIRTPDGRCWKVHPKCKEVGRGTLMVPCTTQ